MDSDWLQRLCDHSGPLGSCFLQEYARSLRLLSGLSRVGYLRALASARHQRLSDAARAAILNHRAVREFTAFLRSFQEQEMPVVCEVLTQQLFPDAPERGLFRAASIDPLLRPEDALLEAQRELGEVEMLIRPEYTVLDEAPRDREFLEGQPWDSERWASVVAGMDRAPENFMVLPSMVSGVVGPAFSQTPDFSHFGEPQVVFPAFVDYEREKRRRRRQVESGVPVSTTRTDPTEMDCAAVADTLGEVGRDHAEHAPEAHPDIELHDTEAGSVKPVDPGQPPEFEEVQEEPLHHPTPPSGVPEPVLPPKRKETESSDRTRKRVSRWDPEEPERGAPGAGPSEPTLVPRFQLFFLPPVGLPKEQVPVVTKLVSQLQALLRRDPPQAVTIVVSRHQCDPMSFSNVSDFGAFLKAFALRSKLSLLSFGKAWSLRYQDKDKTQETTTLFLEVCQVSSSSEHHTTRPKTMPGPKHYDRSRSPPMGKPPGPASGSTGPKSSGSGKRPVFQSHGKQRCLGTAGVVGPMCSNEAGSSGRAHGATNAGAEVPGPASQASTLAYTVLDSQDDPMELGSKDELGHHGSEQAAITEVSPTIPFHAEEPVRPGAMQDQQSLAHSLGYPRREDLHFPRHFEESNWKYFPADGRALGNEDWFTLQSEGVQAVLRGFSERNTLAALRDLRFSSLGGPRGCTVVGPQCRFQLAKDELVPTAEDARAYKVRPVCPHCFQVFSLQDQVFDCPSCGQNLQTFRLPLPDDPASSDVDRVFAQFKSHHDVLGRHSGMFNVAFHIVDIFQGFWKVKGPLDEFWILIPSSLDPWIHPRVGQHYFLFQGPCVGTIGDVPVMFAPPPNGQGALVRQHDAQDPPRALELFSGIGGWHQARRAMGGSDVPILSLDIDPIPARSLAQSTNRSCFHLEQWLTDPALLDAVVIGDIRNPAWWISSLVSPFSEMMFSAPCVPWSVAGGRQVKMFQVWLPMSTGQRFWESFRLRVFRFQSTLMTLLNLGSWIVSALSSPLRKVLQNPGPRRLAVLVLLPQASWCLVLHPAALKFRRKRLLCYPRENCYLQVSWTGLTRKELRMALKCSSSESTDRDLCQLSLLPTGNRPSCIRVIWSSEDCTLGSWMRLPPGTWTPLKVPGLWDLCRRSNCRSPWIKPWRLLEMPSHPFRPSSHWWRFQ